MNAMRYEGFVRGAFSIHSSTTIDRRGDLGGLAEADIFRGAETSQGEYLDEIKTGTAYAMSIFISEIINTSSVADADYNTMVLLRRQVLSANTAQDVFDLIGQFTPIRDQYFTFPWNR